MPPKGRAKKRGAPAAVISVARADEEISKKHRHGDPALQAVADYIEEAKALPADVRCMLVAMMPFSLGASPDERDEHQAMVVSMIGETLHGMKTSLEHAVVDATANANSVEATRSELSAKVASCEADLNRKQDVVIEENVNGATKEMEVQTIRAAMTELEQTAKTLAQPLERAALKKLLEDVLAGPFKELQEGSFATQKDAKKYLLMVLPLLKKVGLEESLQVAVPASCIKKPEARSAFDKMVFDQVGQQLAARVAESDAELEALTRLDAEHASAQMALEAAQEATQASAQACKALTDAVHEAESNLKVATQAFDDVDVSLAIARDEAIAELKNFAVLLEHFEALKNGAADNKAGDGTPTEPAAASFCVDTAADSV